MKIELYMRFFLVLIFSQVLNADMIEPSPYCSKPSKPLKPYAFSNQFEIDSYKLRIEEFINDAERYKRCIQAFVEEQENDANTHKNAANNAIKEWNNFVAYELN